MLRWRQHTTSRQTYRLSLRVQRIVEEDQRPNCLAIDHNWMVQHLHGMVSILQPVRRQHRVLVLKFWRRDIRDPVKCVSRHTVDGECQMSFGDCARSRPGESAKDKEIRAWCSLRDHINITSNMSTDL